MHITVCINYINVVFLNMSDLLLRMRAIFCIFWHTKINLGLKGLIKPGMH